MNILVTNTDSPFAGAVADRLAERHAVRRIGWEEPLEADAATDDLVAGIGAVVHFGYPRTSGQANALIDHATRRTYNLLLAAAAAGVERCVYVSTLRLFAGPAAGGGAGGPRRAGAAGGRESATRFAHRAGADSTRSSTLIASAHRRRDGMAGPSTGVLRRRPTYDSLERGREYEWVLITHLRRDVLDSQPFIGQELGRPAHPQPDKLLARGSPKLSLGKSFEVLLAHVGDARHRGCAPTMAQVRGHGLP